VRNPISGRYRCDHVRRDHGENRTHKLSRNLMAEEESDIGTGGHLSKQHNVLLCQKGREREKRLQRERSGQRNQTGCSKYKGVRYEAEDAGTLLLSNGRDTGTKMEGIRYLERNGVCLAKNGGGGSSAMSVNNFSNNSGSGGDRLEAGLNEAPAIRTRFTLLGSLGNQLRLRMLIVSRGRRNEASRPAEGKKMFWTLRDSSHEDLRP